MSSARTVSSSEEICELKGADETAAHMRSLTSVGQLGLDSGVRAITSTANRWGVKSSVQSKGMIALCFECLNFLT